MQLSDVMRAVGLVLFATTIAVASQSKQKAPPSVPKKIADKITAITKNIKTTQAKVLVKSPDQYVSVRGVARDVSGQATLSDFADKPYTAQIVWTSQEQQSKIYANENDAAQSDDWLEPGRVAGGSNASRPEERYTATLYFIDDKWTVDHIDWMPMYGNAKFPRGMQRPGMSSTRTGQQTDWQPVLESAIEASASSRSPKAKPTVGKGR